MAEPLTVPFSVPGLKTASRDAMVLAAQFKAAGQNAQIIKLPAGPFQALKKATDNRSAASVMGATPAQWRDLAYQQQRAQERVEKIMNPRRGPSPVQKFLRNSSVLQAIGGNAGAAMTGALSMIGPEGAAAASLIEGLKGAVGALEDLTTSAATASRNFTTLNYATGGTNPSAARQLGEFGRAAGTDAASLAQQIQQEITGSDFWARSAAAHYGIQNQPFPYGNRDIAGQASDLLERIHNDPDQAGRLERMQNMKLPPEVQRMLQMSDSEWQEMKRSGKLDALVNGKDTQQKFIDLDAGKSRADAAQDRFNQTFTKNTPFAKNANEQRRGLYDDLTYMFADEKTRAQMRREQRDKELGALTAPETAVIPTNGHTSALERNNQLLENLNLGITGLNTVLGNGESSGRAVGAGMHGPGLNDAITQHAYNLGWF